MGNPIQYRNPNNPSQIQGWVSHNKGGFRKTAFIVMVRPPGAYLGGVNENFSPADGFVNSTVKTRQTGVYALINLRRLVIMLPCFPTSIYMVFRREKLWCR